ncbi:MAG: hypothetical protein JHC84_21140, partial [Solirubrobacteraceae bacterium]|nr:hypothetical protein [Solirubrobacteraceae bacterium]
QNAEDIEEIPEHLRAKLAFTFVDRIEEVLDQALRARRVAKPNA